MTTTSIHRLFDPIKRYLPRCVSSPIRSAATALLTPIFFSYRTGHFISSLRNRAVSKRGKPIPWYTYPAIDFLSHRNYQGKTVLEFGGGQSTLWWAERADHVVALEGDPDWYRMLRQRIPANVELHLVSMDTPECCVAQSEQVIASNPYSQFDVVVIDGLHRYELISIARRVVKKDGIIVCDNAEGYGFYEGFKDSGLNRVDFFGNAPGVVLPHCTSIFFDHTSFAFDSAHRIPIAAAE